MRVHLVNCGGILEPFGVSAAHCPLGDGTFADARERTFRRLGLVVVPVVGGAEITGPALVVADDLWLTTRALRAFLAAVKGATEVTRLRLPQSRQLELFLPLQDVDVDDVGAIFPCAWVPAGTTTTAAAAHSASHSTTIAYKEMLLSTPVPRALFGTTEATTAWPLTSTVVMRVRHWVHVLRASHLAPQVWLLERAIASPLRSSLRVLSGLRFGDAARVDAWKRAFVFRGARTRIHPSAVVEGSIIGDDVVIGPQAVVLQSVIGAGSRLEQRTHVNQCTLGPRTFMSLNSSLQACVTFADADACANNLQACVIGAGAGLTSFARALDTVLDGAGRPGGAVQVVDGDRRRSAGELPCGIAVGPGVWLGADVTVAAGRAIPAHARLTAGDGSLLRRTEGLREGLFAVVDGGVRPLPMASTKA